MELFNETHPLSVKTLITALTFTLVFIGALSAQKPVYAPASDLAYDSHSKKINYRSSGKPFTGIEYTMNYYSKDTTQLRSIYNGVPEWSKYYGYNKVLSNHQIYYIHGLKSDSVCMERITYFQNGKDTNYYEVQYLTKDKKKIYVQKQYQQGYNSKGHLTGYLYSVRMFRFFHKRDAQFFSEQQYRNAASYDSAGFHSTYADYGPYYEYHSNGTIKAAGTYNGFDYRVKHRGAYATAPYYGKTGIWNYYRADGSKERQEIYKDGRATVETIYWFANGKMQTRMNYSALFSELSVPGGRGIACNANDTCFVMQASWKEDGIPNYLHFKTCRNDLVAMGYHADGKPSVLTMTDNAGKPKGCHITWDDKGNIAQFINYSVETNDTVCYTAVNGRMKKLSLRNRSETMGWSNVKYNYNATSLYLNLQMITTAYYEFHSNGKAKSKTELRNGKRNGEYSEWDSTGSLIVQANFKNDQAEGQWAEWYPGGKMKKLFFYSQGIRDGTCVEYYPSGELKWQNTYVNGLPGKAKAFAENGTLLPQSHYPDAFYPAGCIKTQRTASAGVALGYYLRDTAMSSDVMTFHDSLIRSYRDIVMVARTAYLFGGDYCNTAPESMMQNDGTYDAFQSKFIISSGLNTETNRQKMKAFFTRHGITMSEPSVNNNPVLGLEKEFVFTYKSILILNKKAIMDSLEYILLPNANDVKQGYVMSIDINQPATKLSSDGTASIASSRGYSEVGITRSVRNGISHIPIQATEKLVVYDDLTWDFRQTVYTGDYLNYWPLKP